MDGLALSALDWWEKAGVDTYVDETPRDWLARVVAAPPPSASPAEPQAPAPVALPTDLAAFRAWLLSDPSVPGRASARFDAVGDPASGTMILVDMPEMEDRTARALLSGETGALLDRMLGAMGLSRETIYLAAFSPARSASGSLDPSSVAMLLPIAHHHIGLAAPKKLLLMGDAPARAFLNTDSNQARGTAHQLAIGEAVIPTIATFAPRFVAQASADQLKTRRAMVWADLQLFMAL